MALLGTGGLVDAFLGHWWLAGWVWTSIVVFLAMTGILIALAIPYYRRLRLAVAQATSSRQDQEIDRLSASPVPVLILAVGLVGLVAILWLMVFKPF
jgi:membrane protein implicated in regulation of membrane protease activity